MTAQNTNQTASPEVDLIALNDVVSALLADNGWTPDTDEKYEELNDLVHEVGEKVSIFLKNNS